MMPVSSSTALVSTDIPTAEADTSHAMTRSSMNPSSMNSLMHRLHPDKSGASPGLARIAQDGSVMSIIRRQMECLEERLGGHVMRIQEQSDQVSHAMLARVDSKMGLLEAVQPKLDRRIAELSGNYTGLSEEMQTQVRRLDGMETRLWEWRHQLEEEIRGRLAESDMNYARIQSTMRTTEDAFKQHDDRMHIIEQHITHQAEADEDIAHLNQRVADIEIQNSEMVVDRDINQSSVQGGADVEILTLKSQLADNNKKIEHLIETSLEIQERVQVHEETVKYLKTLYENEESRSRQLLDRVEHADWDGRIKELQSSLHELDQQKMEQSDSVELLKRKLEATELAGEETIDRVRRLQDQNMRMAREDFFADDVQDLMTNFAPPSDGMAFEQLESQLEIMRDEILQISERTKKVEEAGEIGPRVANLVNQLSNVAPKVIQQQKVINEITERINQIDAQISRLCTEIGSQHNRTIPWPPESNLQVASE